MSGHRASYAGHPYVVDAEQGIVYGILGKPIRKKITSGYTVAVGGPHHKRRYLMAHVIIWESVHGTVPEGMQINHINGIKTDNRIANLELTTPSENTRHAYKLGLRRADGQFNGRAISKRRSA